MSENTDEQDVKTKSDESKPGILDLWNRWRKKVLLPKLPEDDKGSLSCTKAETSTPSSEEISISASEDNKLLAEANNKSLGKGGGVGELQVEKENSRDDTESDTKPDATREKSLPDDCGQSSHIEYLTHSENCTVVFCAKGRSDTDSKASLSDDTHHRNSSSSQEEEQKHTMPFRPHLRSRHLKAAADSSQSHNGGSDSYKISDDWAEISSPDTGSRESSQIDVASTSTDDSTSEVSREKSRSKSSLEEPSEETSLPRGRESMRSQQSLASSEWSDDQKRVYEMQLENLQEQLVDIMIENQTLAQRLQKYDNSDIIPLLKKLDDERERNLTLTQRCQAMEECMINNRPLQQLSVDAEEVDLNPTNMADSLPSQDEVDGSPPSQWERLQNYVMDKVFTIVADLTEETEETEVDTKREGDELTVKKLKENLKRFKAGYEPGLSFFKALSALVSWKSTSNTFIAFIIYMYAVWKGWFITLLLALMIWYLATTYLISRGWTIQFSFLPYHLIEETPDEGPPLSMSDKFQLVLHVCRKVQNLLGHLADQLEKIHHFAYWTNPNLTKQIFVNLVVAFIASIFFSGSTLFCLIGIFIGVKIFLMNPVLKRYPRLKAKFSFEEKVFREVPTNAELEQRLATAETEQFLVPDIEGITVRLADDLSPTSKPASKRWRAFSQIFKLPDSEQPLKGWKDGKRCTLITKEKNVSSAFKNGRLYLTKSFLCFGKSRLLRDGNMIIPLKDVTRIEKAKPFNFLPGSGMSIEVHQSSAEKPVLFGGILNRDQVHSSILKTWQAAQTAIQRRNSQRESGRSLQQDGSSTSRGDGSTAEGHDSEDD